MPEVIVNKATMDHIVAAPRILHMAAQFLERGHNVDQLSTMDSVYFKEKPRQRVNPKCLLPLF
jgi:hypothetical protein